MTGMTTRLDEAPVRAMDESGPGIAGLPWPGWVILLLTAVLSVIWSANKQLWQDEIFSFQTDRVASLGEVMRIERSYPISLEPPLYHVLSHGAMAMFGPTAFALRLPALCGFLLMQVGLYFFVRNLAGSRAGLVAMTVPVLALTMYYSAEGRPYGMLLGTYAMVALCWQIASRRAEVAGSSRLWPLIGLAVALGMALNLHFYGVLLLVPLCGAELVRTISRRRLDAAMLVAIGSGTALFAAAIPYIKASAEFKKHYYLSNISPHLMTQPYRQMMLDYTDYSMSVQRVLALAIWCAGAVVVWGCLRAVRRRDAVIPVGEWTMILLMVLIPVFAFVVGRLVTHTLEVRHSTGAIVGISALVAISLAPMLRRKTMFYAVMAVAVAGMMAATGARILRSAAATRQTMAALTIPPELKAEVDAAADRNIYFQNLGKWETASLYEPDPEMRSRLVLVYSLNEEMTLQNHDTMYLTAVHTKRFSSQPIVSYDDLRKTPGEHIFAVFHSDWDWTDYAFAEEALSVEPIGKALGGDLVKVRFR